MDRDTPARGIPLPRKGDLGTIPEGPSTVPVRVTEDMQTAIDKVKVVPRSAPTDDSPRSVPLREFTPDD